MSVYTSEDGKSPKQIMTEIYLNLAGDNDLKIDLKSDESGDWAKIVVLTSASGREVVTQVVARRVPGHPEFTVCFVGIWTSDLNDVVAQDFDKTVWGMTVRSVD